jgi:patatin-like phospholipase/acyl hydrolase
MAKFRILSIDGGGVRGYLPAAVLANLEQRLDQTTRTVTAIGHRFDLIVGTSVGGILALALALGMRAEEAKELLARLIPQAFRGSIGAAAESWILPKYDASHLERQLVKIFGNQTLADLKVDVCITSVSLPNAYPRFHKTDYLARNAGRLDESLLEVAMATSAAPTYFPARSTKHSVDLVDGGLVANNPSVIGIVDALQFERQSKRGVAPPTIDELVMLSLGTGSPGSVPYTVSRLRNGGKLHWAIPVYEVLMLSQAKLAHHQAEFLLRDRYMRLNPTLTTSFPLDDIRQFADLKNYADITAQLEAFATTHLR